MISVNLTLENPAILPVIEKLLAGIQGIIGVDVRDDSFENEIPNAETRAAIEDLRAGGGIRFDSVDEMFEYLDS
jgi:hypothetical protein